MASNESRRTDSKMCVTVATQDLFCFCCAALFVCRRDPWGTDVQLCTAVETCCAYKQLLSSRFSTVNAARRTNVPTRKVCWERDGRAADAGIVEFVSQSRSACKRWRELRAEWALGTLSSHVGRYLRKRCFMSRKQA